MGGCSRTFVVMQNSGGDLSRGLNMGMKSHQDIHQKKEYADNEGHESMEVPMKIVQGELCLEMTEWVERSIIKFQSSG